MARFTALALSRPAPAPAVVLELLKPLTWFPPVWAFGCGVISTGTLPLDRWPFLLAGLALTGPLVCGTSQAVNDWFDRHVDAINEPGRPIPSGRMPGQWGLWIAIAGTLLAALVAFATGPWVFAATLVGLACAWAYSAPPLRFKMSGWLGPAVVALSYEGLAWFTGAAATLGALPPAPVLATLLLYSLGAHGIMTLNDFKAVDGDRRMGIGSLPVTLGVETAARLACWVMALPQAAVIALLWSAGATFAAAAVALVLIAQLALMRRLLSDPRAHAPWYNATGTSLYVTGMLAAALGLGW